MIDYKYSDLFEKGSVKKKLLIKFDDTTISNDRIYQEGLELAESLCSQNELRFGCCEASVMKLKIRNEFGNLMGKSLGVSMVLNNNTDTPFKLGKYKANSCELSGDKKYLNITSYDSMYDIINANVVAWYDSLNFPLKMKAFRDSFFTYMGIEQEETTLIQDEVLVEKTIDADEISGLKVISAICELNGVFGHINRDGKFVYVSLLKESNYLYPSVELFPSDSLYAMGVNEFGTSRYQSCQYEDFLTQVISKVQIRQEENDIGAVAGEGTNLYVVEDNFLVYGKGPEALSEICTRLYNKISGIYYRPFNAVLQGNPCIEVGDDILIHTKTMDVRSYVLERTIKGIQSLKDTFDAKGVYEYEYKGNSIQKEIRRLKGKSNVLERTVEETKETITDVENGLQAEIVMNTQTISQSLSETSKKLEDETGALKSSQSSIKQQLDQVVIDFQNETTRLDEQGKEIASLKNTSYKFGTEDLTIEKSGSKLKTRINEDGMRVYEGEKEVLRANSAGVDARNLHATTYLIVGQNSRFEDYDNGKRTGCFWIGGND